MTGEAQLKAGGTIAALSSGASFQRRARPTDTDAIWTLIDTYAQQGILLPWSRDEIGSEIDSFRVAVLDEKVCGTAALREFGRGLGELRSLSVAKEAQSRGLGEVLVRAVVRDAARAGISRLFVLTARPDYFGRFGFEEIPWEDVPSVLEADRGPDRPFRRWNTAMVLHPRPTADPNASRAQEREARVHLRTYARQPLTLVRGSGSWVWDDADHRYLDLVAGLAVNILGHAHPAVAAALASQARTLLQVSNLYYTLPQLELAEKLLERSPFDKAFFVNSGTEANEGALKLARRAGGARGATEVVALEGSFHGRTYGSLSATGQPKYQAPFEPMVPGFRHVPPNDVAALEAAVSDVTCAVLLEPVQGEGGVHPLTDEFLLAARAACDKVGALLIFDEVQTGMGRTGTFFAFEQTPVEPDVVTVAKGLGGGVPIGAFLAKESAAVFQPGDHGTTLGGNPLACAAALATLQVLDSENLLAAASAQGARLAAGLQRLVDEGYGVEVRGRGLMLALETAGPWAKNAVELARDEQGLLINATGDTTLRFIPALTISDAEVDEALRRLRRALQAAAS
jgi:predicted acetylornithine/succinylornithine family transaminase